MAGTDTAQGTMFPIALPLWCVYNSTLSISHLTVQMKTKKDKGLLFSKHSIELKKTHTPIKIAILP